MIKPKVSVIIPAFNVANTIQETLRSVFFQTYDNFEVLVVDDGSTDDTLTILQEEANLHENLRIFTKKNGGPASARNIGLRNAQGEYIAFIDGNDLWVPEKLTEHVQYMDEHSDIGYSYTDAECFRIANGKHTNVRNFVCAVQGDVFKNQFWSNFIINSTVIMRRSCIETVGLQDETQSFIGVEDFDYWLRLNREFKLGCVSKILTKYRLSDANLVGDSYEKGFSKHVLIYKKFYDKFETTEELVGYSKNAALSDLYLRYAFKNFEEEDYLRALMKVSASARYNLSNALKALRFIIVKNKDWSNLITDFKLWSLIIGAVV